MEDEERTFDLLDIPDAYTIISATDELGEHVTALCELLGAEYRTTLVAKIMDRLLDGVEG